MSIADFDDTELWVILETLKERYGEDREYELTDCELQLNPSDPALTLCPTVFWPARDCNFVVLKVANQEYGCQFFYDRQERYGTGRHQYDNLAECLTTLLQVQADHEKERARIRSGLTGDQIR